MQRILRALARGATRELSHRCCIMWEPLLESLGQTATKRKMSSQANLLSITQRLFCVIGSALLAAYILILVVGLADSRSSDDYPQTVSARVQDHPPAAKGNLQVTRRSSLPQSAHYQSVSTELVSAPELSDTGNDVMSYEEIDLFAIGEF